MGRWFFPFDVVKVVPPPPPGFLTGGGWVLGDVGEQWSLKLCFSVAMLLGIRFISVPRLDLPAESWDEWYECSIFLDPAGMMGTIFSSSQAWEVMQELYSVYPAGDWPWRMCRFGYHKEMIWQIMDILYQIVCLNFILSPDKFAKLKQWLKNYKGHGPWKRVSSMAFPRSIEI